MPRCRPLPSSGCWRSPRRFGAPLHLAVIPEPATAELADRLRPASRIFALPHGWRHRNNAPPDQKKAEFGAHRPLAVMLDEIAMGWRRIEELFGRQALPIFTPPWNRIAPAAAEGLPGIGLRVLSTFAPRAAKFAAEHLLQVNTHLDPVGWHAGGGFWTRRNSRAKSRGSLRIAGRAAPTMRNLTGC